MTIHRNLFLAALGALALEAGVPTALAGTKSSTVEPVESVPLASVGDSLATLANEVNLAAWTQIAASQDFRTLEESWVAVYSPRDPVGAAQDWKTQVQAARVLTSGPVAPAQQRWLARFIKAGEAVARKDSPKFMAAVRAMENEAATSRTVLAANQNFFTAK